METFGEYLRMQREKKGIRLEEIASITKIHLHSLQHLEKGLWDELPPEPFIRGFIIAYAKYVGLEPKEVLERYALEHGKSNPKSFELGVVSTTPDAPTETEVPPVKRPEENPDEVLQTDRTLPIRKIAYAALGLVGVLAIGLLVSLGKQSSEPVAKTETPVAQNSVPETAPPAATTETGAPSTGPSNANRMVSSKAEALVSQPTEPAKRAEPEFPHVVAFETKERSWGKVVIDDKPPTEFYSEPGKPLTYQAKEKIKLVLGNAAGSTVTHNGEKTEGKRFNGTIRYYVFPTGARFPQDVPKRKEASEAPAKAENTEPAPEPPANNE